MKLTQEQKRVLIAQACGLNPIDVPFTRPDGDRWFTPEAAKVHHQTWPRGASVKVIPDYFNDLNAMHEAEKTLTQEQFDGYKHVSLGYEVHSSEKQATIFRGIVHATATQRAEAFGKTLNLWEREE